MDSNCHVLCNERIHELCHVQEIELEENFITHTKNPKGCLDIIAEYMLSSCSETDIFFRTSSASA